MTEILMATYNGAAYLTEQLESLLSQTDQDWQLVVRDDGSSDETPVILQLYAWRMGARMRLLPGEGHIGCLKSYELLLRESRADYCLLADQDDVWLPDKIRHARDCMEATEAEIGKDTPIIAYSDLLVTDAQLHVLGSYRERVKLRPDLLQTPEQLAVNNYVTGCTMMLNRAAMEVALPFGDHAVVHDAVIALSVCARGGRLVDIGHADILYRQHGDNSIGATAVEKAPHYVWRKLTSLGRTLRQQQANYRQARDIIPITPIQFIRNRIHYLLQR